MSDDPGVGDDLARDALARARAGAGVPRHAAGSAPAARRRTRRRAGGAETSMSGAHPDDRDPQPVGATVDDLVTERGWSTPLAVGGVEGRWAQVVGDDIAAHCTPEEYEGGKLVVRADSTAWATQVRLLAPTLLARLNTELGAGTVTHVQVLGPTGPSWRKGLFRVKDRGPRDTYG